MSETILQHLPGTGTEVVQSLRAHGWTFEQTYTELIRLYDKGKVRLVSSGCGDRRQVWEAM